MRREIFRAVLVISIALSSLACAARRPVLNPNEHLETVGLETAQRDVDECLRWAGQTSGQAGKIAGSTAMGTATGAAVGAASGAVFGSAASGAAAGAAGGAAGGLLQGLLRSRGRDLSPEQRQLAEKCLRDKGYEIRGWD